MNFITSILKPKNIYVFGWVALAGSLCISEFATSTAFIIIACAWFLEWEWNNKLTRLKQNLKPLLGVVTVFLVFILGLITTENWAFAGADLNRKLPLLALPILYITGSGLSKKQINWVFITLGGMGILTSLIGSFKFYFFDEVQLDQRQLSPFISLIRVSIVLVFFQAYCFWQFFRINHKWKGLLFLPILWIALYLSMAQSLTGIVSMIMIVSIVIVWKVFSVSKILAYAFISVGLLSTVLIYSQINGISNIVFKSPGKYNSTQMYTVNGNSYDTPIDTISYENGNYVWFNFCQKELEKEWDKNNSVKFRSFVNTYQLKYCIARYMTWKGLTKDSVGYYQLTPNDMETMLAGQADPFLAENKGLKGRLYQTMWEFKNHLNGTISFDNSVSYRLILWQIGIDIFKENPILGCGTGDVQDEFNRKFENEYFKYADKRKRRTHNQFIAVALSTGIIGLILFLGSFLFPLLMPNKEFWFLTICFYLIYGLGMLWEDSMESQAGATIYGLLVSLLFFTAKEK